MSQYFWPENFRVNEIALELKNRGHEVTVLTGIPNYPSGFFFEGYGFFKKRRQVYNGIRVIRAPLIPRGNCKWQLILNYFSFTLFSSLYALFMSVKKYDIIFVFEVSPIFIGIPAILYKALRKTPVLFWILDLWPESLVSTDSIKSGVIFHAVDRLVRQIYRTCDLLLVASRGFLKSITAKQIPESKIRYFPNMVEKIYFSDLAQKTVFPEIKGFRILFAGNMGVSQDFPNLLKTCEMTKEYQDIQWIFVGEGRMTDWVKSEVRSRKLSNVHLKGSFPQEAMPSILKSADLLLVSLKRSPIFELTVPGKVQSYMASGKPIVAMMDGEGARLIEESGCGFASEAENPGDLFKNILRIYELSRDQRERLGTNGKKYSIKNFESGVLMDNLEAMMKSVL